MTAPDRGALLRRARALKAKTIENGCTEAEALAAAELLAKLLQTYNLDLDEEELRASPFERRDQVHADEVGSRLWVVAVAIAKLTGARWWSTPPGVHPVRLTFFGFAHEADVATYLLEICARAMRTELEKLRRGLALLRPARQQLRIRPFLDGMAQRLRERILRMIPPAPTGTGLVVLRDQLIADAMDRIGISLQDFKARSTRNHEPDYQAGRNAADAVALNRGLQGGPIRGRLA